MSAKIREQVAALTSKIRSLTALSLDILFKESADVRMFHLPIDPCPASRPKFTPYGATYSKNYNKFRQRAKRVVAKLETEREKITGPVAIIIENVVLRPPTGRKLWPRGDVDNYAKGPMDAMTQSELEAFWNDDDQVVWMTAIKRYAEPDEEPHVNIWFCEVEPTEIPRGIDIEGKKNDPS